MQSAVVYSFPSIGAVASSLRGECGEVSGSELCSAITAYYRAFADSGRSVSGGSGCLGGGCLGLPGGFPRGCDAAVVDGSSTGVVGVVDEVKWSKLAAGACKGSRSCSGGCTVEEGRGKCGSDAGGVVEQIEGFRDLGELGSSGRGPNWSRNKINREKQKRRKVNRQEKGVDWRKRLNKQEIVHFKNGFFSDCPQSVQTQLKESRAKLLIAENLRKEQEERRKIDKMNSPEQIFLDAMEMVDFAGKAAKKANDSKVAGWVQTVASSRAESIAKSAPSSVPSFESVSEKLEESAATSVSAREILLEEKLSQAYSENSDLKNKLGRLSLEKRSAVEEAETLLQKKYDAVMNRVRELESASVEQSVREYAVLPSRRGFFG